MSYLISEANEEALFSLYDLPDYSIMHTVFPRVVPAGTIDFTYWIDAASIRGRPLFEGGFYFFRSHGRERWKFRVLKEATTYTSVYGLL